MISLYVWIVKELYVKLKRIILVIWSPVKIKRTMSKLLYVSSGGIITYLLLNLVTFMDSWNVDFFKQYCCSFYGSPLWGLDCKGVESLSTAWHKVLRMLWRLPPMTQTFASISDVLPLELQLNSDLLLFMKLFKENALCKCLKRIICRHLATILETMYR